MADEGGQPNANLDNEGASICSSEEGHEDIEHTGANGVAGCFSAASISTDSTSAAVMNASMKTPCARFTSRANTVLTTELVKIHAS